ncbi:hypothetical protein E2562_005556 [Oryza meyeriana var. granulata]|uniref:Uncharacterized protein n=1 Tax=Oryza meyeriana var. granulata TaxID=110450 RepID=A0A6G1F3Y6_9ORYZ|nr:hypothetical protein E2562_005556 [Oryza meyeriana var. granulata]
MPYLAASASSATILAVGGSTSTNGYTPVKSLLGPNTSSPNVFPMQHNSLIPCLQETRALERPLEIHSPPSRYG